MQLKISSQFAKDFKSVNDVLLREKIENVLNVIKTAKKANDIPRIRKINGNDYAYKMGIGFYYLVGIMTSDHEMTLMRFLHRDQILKIINQD